MSYTFGNNKRIAPGKLKHILHLAVLCIGCILVSQCRSSTKTSATADGFVQAHEFRIRAQAYHNEHGSFPKNIGELLRSKDPVIRKDDWIIPSSSEVYLIKSSKVYSEGSVPFRLAITRDYEVVVLKE